MTAMTATAMTATAMTAAMTATAMPLAATRPARRLRAARDPARWVALTDAMGRYADGDAAAFEAVYATLEPLVRRSLTRWVGPELTPDLAQKTFLKVHRARQKYRRGSPVGPWVLAIARNLAIDEMRRQGRAREDLTREGLMPEPPALDGTPPDEKGEIIEAVREAIAALPPSQRTVVAMHKLEERPFKEVAAQLGIKEGAARIRAHRAYDRLRKHLARFYDAA